MNLTSLIFLTAAVGPVAVSAQTLQVGKPSSEGDSLYRSNCAFCHGVNGKGGRGPDLTGARHQGETDADVRRVIQQGIAGTTMPAFANFLDSELVELVKFVQTFRNAASASSMEIRGDATAGQRVYQRAGCSGCHKIGSEGSIYGPALTRIGAARSPEYIVESLKNPSADVPPEWEGVSVTTNAGKKYAGIKVNEDTFTVQLRDPAGKFLMFEKSDLKDVTTAAKSLMPAYDKLPAADAENLLAYLVTLRGSIQATGPAKRAKGIH